MERESLYAAICADPCDDLPKLVFADWLDEHGDAVDRAHAELIRIQCEWDANARVYERALEPYMLLASRELLPPAEKLAKVDVAAGRARAMLERAASLESLTKGKSREPLKQYYGASYRHAGRIRGLRTELKISMEQTWETHIGQIAAGFPLRELMVGIPQSRRVDPWDHGAFDTRVLSNLESLSSYNIPLTALTLAIVASPSLVHLKRLKTRYSHRQSDLFAILERAEHLVELAEIEIDRFAASGSIGTFTRFHGAIARNLRRLRVGYGHLDHPYPSLPLLLQFVGVECKLEELEISDSSDTEDGVAVLTRGEIDGSHLVKLAFPLGGLTARGACELMTSARFPKLRQLDISENVLGDLIGKRLERTASFPGLHSLDMSSAHLTADGIAALARWNGFNGLRKLELSGNGINHASMRCLISADAPNLRTLGLRDCNLHGSHIRELAQSRFVRSLWNLDLRGNEVDDAFTRALVETPFLDELQCLLLDLPDDDPGYDRLKARFGDRFQSA